MPNELTEIIMSDFTPKVAIMVYAHSSREYYLESHEISDGGQILAGKPLLQETIQQMVDLFFDERQNTVQISGLIPENLLSHSVLPGGRYKLCWFRPAETRVIHHATQLKLKTAKVNIPPLVYLAGNKGLNVYAFTENARPTEVTVLHKAPFFNVNDDGDVCLGSAKVQKPKVKTYSNLIKYWEDLFWLSEFTHTNGDQKVKSKDMQKLWRSLLGTNKKFPIKELLPMSRKNKLKDII